MIGYIGAMRRSVRSIVLVGILLFFAGQLDFCETAADAFSELHGLIGEWDATAASGRVIHVSYRTLSRDSALVETFRAAPGDETLTIYHLDGPVLVATH
jgi:hypothetical protein